MTEQVGQLDLCIEAGSDAEADELAALAGQLRELLLTLDVESAEPATAEPAAPGSRSGGMFLAGALTVVLTQSPELLSHLVELVQSWVSRDQSRTVPITVGGTELEITGISRNDQRELMRFWQAWVKDNSDVARR